MQQLISILIFTLPGLLCYFWIQLMGINPSQKHNRFEMLGISALLWVPVSFLTLCVYNISALVTDIVSLPFQIQFITDTSGLEAMVKEFGFLCYFILASVVFSYIVATIWSGGLYEHMMNYVNNVREERGLSRLSKKPTVWEEIFINNEPKVVEVSKIDNKESNVIGSLRKASRPLEPERNIALDDIDFFTKIVIKFEPRVDKVFIDTKSGVQIKVYNQHDIQEAQEKDIESNDPIF